MKFSEGDIIGKPNNISPLIILGDHNFPDGSKAYRVRHVHPQYDQEDGTEYWDKNDGYLHQDYVDSNYKLIWSRK